MTNGITDSTYKPSTTPITCRSYSRPYIFLAGSLLGIIQLILGIAQLILNVNNSERKDAIKTFLAAFMIQEGFFNIINSLFLYCWGKPQIAKEITLEEKFKIKYGVDIKNTQLTSEKGMLLTYPLPFEYTLNKIKKWDVERKEIHTHEAVLKRLVTNIQIEEDKNLLNSVLVNYEENKETIQDFANLINSGDQDFKSLDNVRFGPLAYAALTKKLISPAEFSTLMMQWAAQEQFNTNCDRVTYSLFKDNELSKEAKQNFMPLLELLPEEEIRFIENMRKASKFEQNFTLIRLNKKMFCSHVVSSNYIVPEITQLMFLSKISPSSLFRFHNTKEDDGSKILIIPSYTIVDAYSKAVFNEDHISPMSELGGLSDFIAIEQGVVQGTSPLAIPFPGFQSNVRVVHKDPVGLYGSIIHDGIHLIIKCIVPKNHRLAVLRSADVLTYTLDLCKYFSSRNLMEVDLPKGHFTLKPLKSEDKENLGDLIENLTETDGYAIFYKKDWAERRKKAEDENKKLEVSRLQFGGPDGHPSLDPSHGASTPLILVYYAVQFFDRIKNQGEYDKELKVNASISLNADWRLPHERIYVRNNGRILRFENYSSSNEFVREFCEGMKSFITNEKR